MKRTLTYIVALCCLSAALAADVQPAAARFEAYAAARAAALRDAVGSSHHHGGGGGGSPPNVDVTAIYGNSIFSTLTEDEFRAYAADDDTKHHGGGKKNSVGVPGAFALFEFQVEKTAKAAGSDAPGAMSPGIVAKGGGLFQNFNNIDPNAVVRGANPASLTGTTATVKYDGKLDQLTCLASGGRILDAGNTKITFVDGFEFLGSKSSPKRKLLARTSTCEYFVFVGNNCEVKYTGSSSQTYTFGVIAETVEFFFRPTVRLSLSCTLDGTVPEQSPAGCATALLTP